MNTSQLSTDQLFALWLQDYATDLTPPLAVIRVRRAVPRFQTRNYFARYKVETAHLEGDGTNPTQVSCVVVEVSASDQTTKVVPETACDSIKDL